MVANPQIPEIHFLPLCCFSWSLSVKKCIRLFVKWCLLEKFFKPEIFSTFCSTTQVGISPKKLIMHTHLQSWSDEWLNRKLFKCIYKLLSATNHIWKLHFLDEKYQKFLLALTKCGHLNVKTVCPTPKTYLYILQILSK